MHRTGWDALFSPHTAIRLVRPNRRGSQRRRSPLTPSEPPSHTRIPRHVSSRIRIPPRSPPANGWCGAPRDTWAYGTGRPGAGLCKVCVSPPLPRTVRGRAMRNGRGDTQRCRRTDRRLEKEFETTLPHVLCTRHAHVSVHVATFDDVEPRHLQAHPRKTHVRRCMSSVGNRRVKVSGKFGRTCDSQENTHVNRDVL